MSTRNTERTYCYSYPRPMVTVDAVVFRQTGQRLEVLVIERGHPPFEGRFALPGGFVEMEEDLLDAAKRELFEETGLRGVRLTQIGAFGRPDRDPRGRNIAVAFAGRVAFSRSQVRAGDDAADAQWVSARRPPPLAFDHREIVAQALRWWRTAGAK